MSRGGDGALLSFYHFLRKVADATKMVYTPFISERPSRTSWGYAHQAA
jgi:hypothetical protein